MIHDRYLKRVFARLGTIEVESRDRNPQNPQKSELEYRKKRCMYLCYARTCHILFESAHATTSETLVLLAVLMLGSRFDSLLGDLLPGPSSIFCRLHCHVSDAHNQARKQNIPVLKVRPGHRCGSPTRCLPPPAQSLVCRAWRGQSGYPPARTCIYLSPVFIFMDVECAL
jgi:hypothetical protein